MIMNKTQLINVEYFAAMSTSKLAIDFACVVDRRHIVNGTIIGASCAYYKDANDKIIAW